MSGGALAAMDIAEQADVLARVLDTNASLLERARDRIGAARVVRLAGFGSSKHAAGYGAEALDILGGRPAIVLPAPGVAVPTPAPHRDEPLIVLSQSGHTPALLEIAKRARAANVAVVAITNEPGSPLEDIASVTLACDAGAERVVAATKSVTAQCLLLRALAREVPASDIAVLVDAIGRTEEIGIPDHAPVAVAVAGFAAEWVADEIALKITEMSGISVVSNSVVEHFHGPKAGAGDVLAFLDEGDPNSDELARAANVTSVNTPTTGDASLDPIVRLVAGQRVARAIALAAGQDPDADRGLAKVTHTA